MRIDIMTLFPETVGDMMNESILGRAQERDFIKIECHQIRDYTTNKQNRRRSRRRPSGGPAVPVLGAHLPGGGTTPCPHHLYVPLRQDLLPGGRQAAGAGV